MVLEQHPELRQLSAAGKLARMSELRDDLAAHPEQVPVTPEQMTELDRRMEAYRQDPAQVATLDAVETRILGGATGA